MVCIVFVVFILLFFIGFSIVLFLVSFLLVARIDLLDSIIIFIGIFFVVSFMIIYFFYEN